MGAALISPVIGCECGGKCLIAKSLGVSRFWCIECGQLVATSRVVDGIEFTSYLGE